jgi:hypothetical protein
MAGIGESGHGPVTLPPTPAPASQDAMEAWVAEAMVVVDRNEETLNQDLAT